MNLQEAIDAPAWHIEHFPLSFWPRTARPGVLVVEGRLLLSEVVVVAGGLVGQILHLLKYQFGDRHTVLRTIST